MPVTVAVRQDGDTLKLTFPFAQPTPAAIFRRADTVWLVFGTMDTISLAGVAAGPGRAIASAALAREQDHAIVRLRLERPRLIGVATEGPAWTVTLGSEVTDPTRPLVINRSVFGTSRSSVTIPIDAPGALYRIDDPEAGDSLIVVTALAPARGFIKAQDFVDFRALGSAHGVVVQPLADDLLAEPAADRIVITRPAGLTLSSAANAVGRSAVYQPHVFEAQTWGLDRDADFSQRKSELTFAAAMAPESRRLIARVELARFYLSRNMSAEAKAVLDVALADSPPTADDPSPLVLHAIANILMGRMEQGLKDLANPFIGNQHDAPLSTSGSDEANPAKPAGEEAK